MRQKYKENKMREFIAKLILFTIVLVVGAISAHGEQVQLTRTWPVRIAAIINSDDGHVKAEFLADVTEITTNSYVFFAILRDPQSGYVWWHVVEHSPQKDTYVPEYFAHWEGQLQKIIWSVSGVGIIEARETDLHVSAMKASSIEDAERQLVAALTSGTKNDLWSLEQHETVVHLPLRESFGDDFLVNPLTAMPRRSPNILSIKQTNNKLSIRLESLTAKTNRVGHIEMDLNFNVLKAVRSN